MISKTMIEKKVHIMMKEQQKVERKAALDLKEREK